MIALPGGFRPRKGLDQYFLRDEFILEREVYLADIKPTDVVLEIGAGNGSLTRLISEKARKVIAVEKDPILAGFLRDSLHGRVEVIKGDALEMDFPSFDKAMGNLPYSVSSPLIFKLLEHDFILGVFCLQYEFAEKMTSSPGSRNYSRLSVMISLRTSMTVLSMTVPRESFWPEPGVDSAIVKLAPEKNPGLDSLSSEVIRMIFTHRRKTLRNAVRDSDGQLEELLGFGQDSVLEGVKTDYGVRVFEMSPPDVLAFARSVVDLARENPD